MADLIQRIAGDVLRAVGIQVRKGGLIGVKCLVWTYFDGEVGADAAQFGILCPAIRLDEFGRAARNRRIAMSPLSNEALLLFANADVPLSNNPAPNAAAPPAGNPPFNKDRRFTGRFTIAVDSFIELSSPSLRNVLAKLAPIPTTGRTKS